MRARLASFPLAPLIIAFVCTFVFHLWLQWQANEMIGFDGYYHMKIAHMYATGEVGLFGGDFPWAAYSSYNDLRADWQLGYHLLLIPFTAFGLVTGGKVSTAFFLALLSATLYWILQVRRIRWPWLYVFLFSTASWIHLIRFHLPRPAALMLTLLLITVHFLERRRRRAAMIAAAALMLVYAVPHSLLLVVAAFLLAGVVADGRLYWREASWAALGALGAILLHPGFWQWTGSFWSADHGLFWIWQQMSGTIEAARNGGRVLVDGEWIPMPVAPEFGAWTGRAMIQHFGFALGLYCATLSLAFLRPLRVDRFALFVGALSFGHLVLFTQHMRFVEYWMVSSVLAIASLHTAALRSWNADRLSFRQLLAALAVPAPRPLLALICLVALLAGTAINGVRSATEMGSRLRDGQSQNGPYYRAAAGWIRDNVPAGEIVFHADWDDFAPLFFYAPEQRYLVSFDPYFFYMHAREKWSRYITATTGAASAEATLSTVESLGARVVFSRKTNVEFIERLAVSPRAVPRFEDARFVVFTIEP